jgi:hypothetical protein
MEYAQPTARGLTVTVSETKEKGGSGPEAMRIHIHITFPNGSKWCGSLLCRSDSRVVDLLHNLRFRVEHVPTLQIVNLSIREIDFELVLYPATE